jgi:hypothetical protein
MLENWEKKLEDAEGSSVLSLERWEAYILSYSLRLVVSEST